MLYTTSPPTWSLAAGRVFSRGDTGSPRGSHFLFGLRLIAFFLVQRCLADARRRLTETADFKVFPFVEEACMVIWQLHSSCGARVLTSSHPVDIFGRQKQVHMKRASAQNSTGSLGIHGFSEPLPLLWSHSRDFVQVCSYRKRVDWCALSLVFAALGVRLLLRLPVTCSSIRFRFVLCAHALALVTPRL